MNSVLIILIQFCFWFANPGLEISLAEKQDYAGGRAASGHGTKYNITVKAKTKHKKLIIEGVWLKGSTYFPVKVYDKFGKKDSEFKKGDELFIAFRKHIKTNNQGQAIEQATQQNAPIKYQGEALLQYKLRGKTKYIAIKQFAEKEKQLRQ